MTFWGEFTERKGYREFIFVPDGKEPLVVQLSLRNHCPILKHVKYEIRCCSNYSTTIVDGRRNPWSVEMHRNFFPALPLPPSSPKTGPLKFNVEYYPTPLPMVMRNWMHFDMDYFIYNLIVPHRPVYEFYPYVQAGNFKHLVREYGGVNPILLRRFLPDVTYVDIFDEVDDVHPLVREAFVIQQLTERMKRERKVWLTPDDLDGLLFPKDVQWNSTIKTLIDDDVLGYQERGLAFAWAAAHYDKYMYAGLRVTFEPDVLPVLLSDDTPAVTTVDTRYPIDKWIDVRRLPTTALVISDPTFASPTTPILPPLVDDIRCDDSLSKICKAAKLILETAGCLTSMCVSKTGMVSMDQPGQSTVVCASAIGSYEKGEVVSISASLTVANSSSVHSAKVDKAAATLSNTVVYPNVKSIGSVSFSDLASINCQSIYVGHVFVIFDVETDARWYYEIKKLEKRNKVTCFKLTNF